MKKWKNCLRMMVKRILIDQWIWHRVIAKAEEVSQHITDEALDILETSGDPLLLINTQLDLYDSETPEILLFEDGIQVKRLKEHRTSRSQEYLPENEAFERKHVNTVDILLQRPKRDFEYLTTPIPKYGNPSLPLNLIVKVKLILQYDENRPDKPLDIVTIVDGASSVRCRLVSLFEPPGYVILNWYHLSSKVHKFMWMIAEDKDAKRLHLKAIMPKLWCDQPSKVIEYLRTQVQARSPNTFLELLTYLEEHASEMIDYRRCQQVGKTMVSGWVEKRVDVVVKRLQKNKGMSWSDRGAILKVVELNGNGKSYGSLKRLQDNETRNILQVGPE